MKRLTADIYLHDAPVYCDDEEKMYDRAGVHIAPHHDEVYRDEGYVRFVFVLKDGEKNTCAYQLPGHIWKRVKRLFSEMNNG